MKTPRIKFMKRIMIIVVAVLIYSCKSDKHETKEIATSFDCPFQEMIISEIHEQYNAGSKISGGLRINLESNIKFLKIDKGEFNFEINDTTILDNVSKQISKKTLYSASFMEIHNSIIQILCSIEKDLQDTTLSNVSREALVKEKIRKRTDYFDFLLASRDSVPNKTERTSTMGDANRRAENFSESRGQMSGITANKVNTGDEYIEAESSTTINKVTSINQQGGITANEVHIYEKEKESELTKENLNLLLQEVFNQILPPNYPVEGNLQIATILHGETVSEFKRYEEKGWLNIESNGNLTNMGANNRIGNSIEDKKRPWGMGNGYIITFNESIYEK